MKGLSNKEQNKFSFCLLNVLERKNKSMCNEFIKTYTETFNM